MLTFQPNRIFGLDKGTLKVGKTADITFFDHKEEYSINPSKFKSRSKNSPYEGWKVRGKILRTLVNGKTVFQSN
jgi:dihydroorotase